MQMDMALMPMGLICIILLTTLGTLTRQLSDLYMMELLFLEDMKVITQAWMEHQSI